MTPRQVELARHALGLRPTLLISQRSEKITGWMGAWNRAAAPDQAPPLSDILEKKEG